MRLCVVAPYGFCELSVAATRLADVARAVGCDVHWLVPDRPMPGLHPHWDRKVSGWPAWKRGLPDDPRRIDGFVWFEHRPLLQTQLQRRWPLSKHWLVLPWQRLDAKRAAGLASRYDRVVSPAPTVQTAVLRCQKPKLVLPQFAKESLTWVFWSAGWPALRRSGEVVPGALRVYVPLDGLRAVEASQLLSLCLQLTDEFPHLQFTFDSTATWPTGFRARLLDAVRRRPQRFAARLRSPLQQRQLDLQQHDFCLLPTPAFDFGLRVVQSLACGVPLLCYDIEPVSGLLQQERNCYLMGCDIECNWLGAPRARFDSSALLEHLRFALQDDALLKRLQQFWPSSMESSQPANDSLVRFWSAEWFGD